MRNFVLLIASLMITMPTMAAAATIDQTTDEGASRVVAELTACRSITDATQRLACFDRTAAALVTAQENKSIVVVDRAEVKKARRSLFGFALPNINLFGKPGESSESDVQEITAKIVKVGLAGQQLFTLTLDDDTIWRMGESLGRYPPVPGDKVNIIRGSLGSFRASIAGSRYIQVNRVR